MAVLVLKRTSDKLDAVLAAVVLMLGVMVLGVYLSAPRLTCVPLTCVGRPYTTLCARDWLYLRFGHIPLVASNECSQIQKKREYGSPLNRTTFTPNRPNK